MTSATLELGGLRRRRRHDRPARRGGAGVARARRRRARSPTPSRASRTSPSTFLRPAATASPPRPSTRSRRSCGPRGRTLGLFSSMRAAKEATEAMRERFADLGGRRRVPVPGRGPDQHPRAAVRPRPAHLPVRHAVAVAGRRRARLVVPARHHRPDPVPAPRRPARPRRARRPSRGWAATASWPSRRPTPRCGSPRAPVGSSAAPTTAASSPSSTTG